VPPLREYEREVVYELFDHIGKDDVVRLSTLRAWWRSHPATALAIEAIWSVRLQQAMITEGLVDPRAAKTKRRLTAYSLFVMFGFALWWVFGIWAFLFLSIGAVMALGTQRLGGLSGRGEHLLAGYAAFGRYLEDYGRFRDKPADAVAVWDEYLPLAIVLGVGGKALDELRLMPSFDASSPGFRYPDEVEGLAYSAYRRASDSSLPEMCANGSALSVSGGTPPPLRNGDTGRWTRKLRQRPMVALAAFSPIVLFPVVMIAAYYAYGFDLSVNVMLLGMGAMLAAVLMLGL
jgi:hypothetical protein